jgi:MbtH protein
MRKIYGVVVNQQYSIWPADRVNPLGSSDARGTGSKTACVAYIEDAWAHIRFPSLRQKLGEPGDS